MHDKSATDCGEGISVGATQLELDRRLAGLSPGGPRVPLAPVLNQGPACPARADYDRLQRFVPAPGNFARALVLGATADGVPTTSAYHWTPAIFSGSTADGVSTIFGSTTDWCPALVCATTYGPRSKEDGPLTGSGGIEGRQSW
jgi:hypothetical protein